MKFLIALISTLANAHANFIPHAHAHEIDPGGSPFVAAMFILTMVSVFGVAYWSNK